MDNDACELSGASGASGQVSKFITAHCAVQLKFATLICYTHRGEVSHFKRYDISRSLSHARKRPLAPPPSSTNLMAASLTSLLG